MCQNQISRIRLKLQPSFYFVHWWKYVHTLSRTWEYMCAFYGVDWNAAVKLCPTFLSILTWASPCREGVCAWMRGMCVQHLGLYLEKTGCAACAFLKCSADPVEERSPWRLRWKWCGDNTGFIRQGGENAEVRQHKTFLARGRCRITVSFDEWICCKFSGVLLFR